MKAEDITIRFLKPGDEDALSDIAPGVFDHPPTPGLIDEYLREPRFHIAVATVGPRVVGMVTGIHYMHPDKPSEFFLNELGVADECRRRGIGRRLLDAMFEHARSLGCRSVWLGTEHDNAPANALYKAAGLAPQRAVFYEHVFGIDDTDEENEPGA